jgi:hypothetical protein
MVKPMSASAPAPATWPPGIGVGHEGKRQLQGEPVAVIRSSGFQITVPGHGRQDQRLMLRHAPAVTTTPALASANSGSLMRLGDRLC